MTRVRVLVADDHAAILDSVVKLLSPEFDVVAIVRDGQAVLEAAAATKPDVLVLDISMPILSGIEAATILKKTGSNGKIVFLTVHEDPDFVRAAHDAGALGFVIKQRMTSDLPTAIHQAVKGKCFTSPTVHFKKT